MPWERGSYLQARRVLPVECSGKCWKFARKKLLCIQLIFQAVKHSICMELQTSLRLQVSCFCRMFLYMCNTQNLWPTAEWPNAAQYEPTDEAALHCMRKSCSYKNLYRWRWNVVFNTCSNKSFPSSDCLFSLLLFFRAAHKKNQQENETKKNFTSWMFPFRST